MITHENSMNMYYLLEYVTDENHGFWKHKPWQTARSAPVGPSGPKN